MSLKSRKLQSYTIILIPAFIILILFSCVDFTEPEPFVNEGINTPVNISYILTDSISNKVLSGIIQIPFVPDSNLTSISNVTLCIDTTIVSTIKKSPYNFSVDTKKWKNGKHTISFLVYKSKSNKGVLELLNIPDRYSSTINIDNSPPIAPKNVFCEEVNNHIRITWQPTKLNNFHSYLIRRNGTIIAEINNQNDSTYIDQDYELSDFYKIDYEVGASTINQVIYTPILSPSKGKSLQIKSLLVAVDNLSDKVIFLSKRLQSFSTINCEKLFDTKHDINLNKAILKSNLNNSELFALSSSRWNKHSLHNLAFIPPVYGASYSCYDILDFVVGLNNIVLLSHKSGYLFNPIYVNQKFYVNKLATFGSPTSLLSISPDGKELIVGDKMGIKKYSIDQDLTTNDVAIDLIQQSAVKDSICLFKVDWDCSRIFVKRQNNIIESFDIESLELLSSFQLPTNIEDISQIKTFNADTKNLYVAYTTKLNNNSSSLLVEYDASSGMQGRTWKFNNEIQSIYLSRQGRYIFACTKNDQWIVDIGGN